MTRLYEDDLGLEQPQDSALFAAPSSDGPGIALSPEQGWAPPAGIGMGDTQAPAPVETRAPTTVTAPIARQSLHAQTLDRMSMPEKIFAAIGEFGAGVQGKPSPFNERLRQQREERALEIEETKLSMDGMKKGLELMEGLEGDARTAFAKQYGAQLERLYPGTGALFEAANDKPSLLTEFKNYYKYLPEPLQILLRDRPKEFRKYVGTDAGRAELLGAEGNYFRKLGSIRAARAMVDIEQHVPPEMYAKWMKDERMSFSEYMAAQKYLPEDKRHPPEELEAIRNDPTKFSMSANLIDPKTENEIAKARAGKADSAPSPLARLQAERAALPPGDPRIATYDNAIRKESETAKQISPTQERRHPVVGVDADGNQTINWASPDQGTQTFDTRPSGSANIEFKDRAINIRQISGKVATETKGERDVLAATNRYNNYVATGDNAQAVTMAAETLRRASMTGNQRFKGEAEKLLGGGYGGGSLTERLANFLSTEATGTPTAKTMAKLNKLMAASEASAIENMGMRFSSYAAQARGKKLPLAEAVSGPVVHGKRVVFPDGTIGEYVDNAAATKYSKLWKETSE